MYLIPEISTYFILFTEAAEAVTHSSSVPHSHLSKKKYDFRFPSHKIIPSFKYMTKTQIFLKKFIKIEKFCIYSIIKGVFIL